MKFRPIHAVICMAGVLTSSVASAQPFGFVQPSFFGDIGLSQSVSSVTNSYVLSQYGDEADEPSPIVGAVDLGFQDDLRATQEAQSALAAVIASNADVSPDNIVRELSSGVLQGEFVTMVQAYDLDPNNLGDVVAAHHLVMWQIVNGTKDPSRAEVAAVSRQMRAALASNPEIGLMDNYVKRREAEIMVLMTMLAAAIYEPPHRAGNQVAVREAQNVIHEYMLAQGLDLKTVALGSAGFFPQ
jgi:hypothetical protein